MEPVARYFLGEPNRALSTRDELRWGSNGSMSVKLSTDQFYDHEAGVGGGVVRFVEHTQAWEHSAAVGWLRENHPDRFPAAPATATTPKAKTQTNGAAGHAVASKAFEGTFEKAYDYTDEAGKLLYQVVRYRDPKTFRQRRPVPVDAKHRNGWDWEVKGKVRPVIYRLPEVLAAIKADRPILVVEGEKDADRLWAAGLPATTNSGGAGPGHWPPELNESFRGADVTIIGDHDPQKRHPKTHELQWHPDGHPIFPGQDHAVYVAGQLAPVAARVRLLRDLGDAWPEAPPKGDVSDYLDAGHNTVDLMALIEALADYGEVEAPAVLRGSFTLASLEGLPIPPRQWHVEGLIPAGAVTLLGGDGGVGKSILALQLAFTTAVGSLRWIGQGVRPGRVLYLSAEDDDKELHRRSDLISRFYGEPLEQAPGATMWSLADEEALLVTGHPGEALETTGRWTELQRFVELDKPALVVLDSLADVYGANENDRSQARQFVRLLRSLALPTETAVVLLGHPSLTGLSSKSGLSGSTAWNNSVRERLNMLAAEAEDGAPQPDLRTLEVKKANYTQAGVELRLRWVAGAFDLDGVSVNALDRQITADSIDELFLQMLDSFAAQGRFVSHNTGRGYAPAMFALDPRAGGTSSKALTAAMNRLFAASRIHVVTRGPPSRRISVIARAET